MDAHLADVWFQLTGLEVTSGSGSVVTARDGGEYLDLTSGIGVVNTGHCHPAVVEAIREQAGRFIHAQLNCYRHDQLAPLTAGLADITPAGIQRFFLTNSGAEATEAAVKLAKQATGKSGVVVFQGSFHGRTHLTMAMTTSKSTYRVGHAPLPSGVFVAPFPYTFLTDEDEKASVARCLREFDLLLTTQTDASELAAIVIEPVLGEGGYVPAPRAFLEGLVDRCRDLGILFVADEVQSGFGRTGEMFAVDHHDLRPDILVMAKGIASGFPMSAVGATDELMARWPTGSHGGTYGGNPIGCAAARATIDVLTAPGFLAHVRSRGKQFLSGLAGVGQRSSAVGENRGLGLMLATEIIDAEGRPDPERAAAILRHLLHEERVIVMACGPHSSTIRWVPPLVIDEDQVQFAVEAFGRALFATGSAEATS